MRAAESASYSCDLCLGLVLLPQHQLNTKIVCKIWLSMYILIENLRPGFNWFEKDKEQANYCLGVCRELMKPSFP